MEAKYIIIDHYLPIVFTAAIQHLEMAQAQNHGLVTSAGFVTVDIIDDKEYGYPLIHARAHGESVSLDIKSEPEKDSKILTKLLRGY